ncbi:MAG: archaeal proteasome endopeptidase complex subunit beta [Candidatus Micrarchaeota archaeon]|nr:archaeal proteasome endopeptidase complex subunit beta [Candidatus Micrarchaeota archaeon]
MELNNEKSVQAVQTGTTTVGLVCKDGVILASDRRATMGYLIASKDIDKVYSVDDHITMTIAGGVGDAQTLIRWMQAELKLYKLRHEKRIPVEAAATLLANILAQHKYYPFFVQLLLGGVDERPRLFSIDMLGGVTEEKFTSTGSGSPIAYGVLEEMYKENGTIEDNLKVAAKAVYSAMKRDAASGERVDITIITKDGFKRFDKNFVNQLIAQ